MREYKATGGAPPVPSFGAAASNRTVAEHLAKRRRAPKEESRTGGARSRYYFGGVSSPASRSPPAYLITLIGRTPNRSPGRLTMAGATLFRCYMCFPCPLPILRSIGRGHPA